MIEHTVSFRLVHAPGSAQESDFLHTARAALADLPGVQDFAVKRQVGAKSDLAFGFSMRFVDQAAYDAYDNHPRHTAFVAERWVPEVESFTELDFTELDVTAR